MSEKSEALRLADLLECTTGHIGGVAMREAAAELRRLHEENQQWQDKCNTYIEIHDAVVKDNERLHGVNAELVEALEDIYEAMYVNEYGDFSLQSHYDVEQLRNALAKAQGEDDDQR